MQDKKQQFIQQTILTKTAEGAIANFFRPIDQLNDKNEGLKYYFDATLKSKTLIMYGKLSEGDKTILERKISEYEADICSKFNIPEETMSDMKEQYKNAFQSGRE